MAPPVTLGKLGSFNHQGTESVCVCGGGQGGIMLCGFQSLVIGAIQLLASFYLLGYSPVELCTASEEV